MEIFLKLTFRRALPEAHGIPNLSLNLQDPVKTAPAEMEPRKSFKRQFPGSDAENCLLHNTYFDFQIIFSVPLLIGRMDFSMHPFHQMTADRQTETRTAHASGCGPHIKTLKKLFRIFPPHTRLNIIAENKAYPAAVRIQDDIKFRHGISFNIF